MSRRHVFVQRAGARGLTEADLRAEWQATSTGEVVEASYLDVEVGFFEALVRRLKGRRDATEPDDVRLVLPFDAAGRDALGLLEGVAAPALDGNGDELGSVRSATGRVACLEPRDPGDEVVLRDLWVQEPPVLRVVESIDFAIVPERGPPIVIACAMAPLVLAPARAAPLGECLALLGARAQSLVAPDVAARPACTAVALELREHDVVEVFGVVGDASTTRRFDLGGRATGYRSAPATRPLLLGDEVGTRLVVRLVSHRAGDGGTEVALPLARGPAGPT